MTTKKTISTLNDATLIDEAEDLLAAHIRSRAADAMKELTEHRPASNYDQAQQRAAQKVAGV